MKYYIKLMLALSAMGFLLGCSNSKLGDGKIGQYEVGSISRFYCRSTDPSTRAELRRLADAAGVTMFDYCQTLGVPLAVLGVYQLGVETGFATPDAEPSAEPSADPNE